MDLDTEGGHVLLLKFTSQVSLDEGGLVEQNELISICRSFGVGALHRAERSRPLIRPRNAVGRISFTHLSSTTITDKHELEGRSLCLLSHSECRMLQRRMRMM